MYNIKFTIFIICFFYFYFCGEQNKDIHKVYFHNFSNIFINAKVCIFITKYLMLRFCINLNLLLFLRKYM